MTLQLRPEWSVKAKPRWWSISRPRVWSKENPLQNWPWSAPPRPPGVVLRPDDSYLENEHLRPDTPTEIDSDDDNDPFN